MGKGITKYRAWVIPAIMVVSGLVVGIVFSGCQKEIPSNNIEQCEEAKEQPTMRIDANQDLKYLDSLAYEISKLVYGSQEFRKCLYDAFSSSTEREHKVRLDQILDSYPAAQKLSPLLSKMSFMPYIYIPCVSFRTWRKDPIPVVPAEVFDENAKEIYGYENGRKTKLPGGTEVPIIHGEPLKILSVTFESPENLHATHPEYIPEDCCDSAGITSQEYKYFQVWRIKLKQDLEPFFLGAPEVYLAWESKYSSSSNCPPGGWVSGACQFRFFSYLDCGNRNCGTNHRNVDKIGCYYTFTCPGPIPYTDLSGFLAFKWGKGCYRYYHYWGPIVVGVIEADWGYNDDCFIKRTLRLNSEGFNELWENSKIVLFVNYYDTYSNVGVNPPCPNVCP